MHGFLHPLNLLPPYSLCTQGNTIKHKSFIIWSAEQNLGKVCNISTSPFFCTRPPPGLLPVLGPLGSGTDIGTKLYNLRKETLRSAIWNLQQVLSYSEQLMKHSQSGIRSTECRGANFNWMRVWRLYTPSHHGWTYFTFNLNENLWISEIFYKPFSRNFGGSWQRLWKDASKKPWTTLVIFIQKELSKLMG